MAGEMSRGRFEPAVLSSYTIVLFVMTVGVEGLLPLRCLLVDHYDSYTHNLKDIFESILGSGNVDEVKCDDSKPQAVELDLTLYDMIVLSPGPGDPINADDLGTLTSTILAMYSDPHRRLPSVLPILFGVCLGHQAIATVFGGKVVPSTPARHGYRAAVVLATKASGIFADVPAQFSAIRYHSLEVEKESLPECLEVLAWSWDDVEMQVERCTIDHAIDLDSPSWLRNLRENCCIRKKGSGSSRRVVMALRHVQLPVFGVQFHPESVCSEFGLQICSNVCRIARDRRLDVCRRPRSNLCLSSPSLPIRGGSTPRDGNLQLLSRRFPIGDSFDSRTFFEYFFCNCVDVATDEVAPVAWLDSAKPSKHSSDGRYTFMCGGRQHARGSNLCVVDEKLHVIWGHDSILKPVDLGSLSADLDSFTLLEEYCEQLRGRVVGVSVLSDLPPLIPPCVIGTLGYDGNSTLYIVTDRLIIIDHSIDCVWALQVGCDDEEWFNTIDEALKGCKASLPHTFCPVVSHLPIEMTVRDSRQCYMDKVEACQQAIAFGDSYELCLTTQITACSSNGSPVCCPLCAYIRLRERNSTNYSAFVYMPTLGYIACGSPERFCKVGEGGWVEMKPIKGTRPRGQDAAEDERLVKDLANSPKDFAENLMVVDLVRNDLNTVCETGSVHCPKLMQVETYDNYHQLVSTVSGRLPEDASPVQALRALFPAGSMTGAPKVRSCRILDSLESGPRGIYSGAIGYISPLTRSADMAVVIRTLIFNGGSMTTGCGGAIVAASNPIEEWDEILVKARPQLWSLTDREVLLTTEVGVKVLLYPKVACLDQLNLFETMLLRSDGRIDFINEHAHRFAKSAATLWGVDQAVANRAFRTVLDARVMGISGPRRLRLEMSCGLVEERWTCEECPTPISCQYLHLAEFGVDHSDLRLRHKTNDRRLYPPPVQSSCILYNERSEVTETPIANIGLRGDDGLIITPPVECGLLPGCYRRWLLDSGKAIERIITLEMLKEYIQAGHEIVVVVMTAYGFYHRPPFSVSTVFVAFGEPR